MKETAGRREEKQMVDSVQTRSLVRHEFVVL